MSRPLLRGLPSRCRAVALVFAALGLAACAPVPPVVPGHAAGGSAVHAFAAALEAEAMAPTSAKPYLDTVDLAAADPDAPGAVSAAIAAIDALVYRSALGLDSLTSDAVAFRSRELPAEVTVRLRAAWGAVRPETHSGGLVRGIIAQGVHELALYAGDSQSASVWGARRGCAAEASLVGPLDATALKALGDPSPVAIGAPFAASFAGVAPFAAKLTPRRVLADACRIDVDAASVLQGERVVVFDVESPHLQRAFFAMTTQSAAVLDVGGVTTIERGFELGGKAVMRLAAVDLPSGRTRVTARVAQRNDGSVVEIDVWGADGLPLRTFAPKTGDVAPGVPARAIPIEIQPVGPGAEELTLAAAAQLGLGEARSAEHLLEPRSNDATSPSRTPALNLLYVRAIDDADDLPDAKARERMRAALDQTLTAWPNAWEARIAHAHLTERRRGAGDGPVEALKELGVSASGRAEGDVKLKGDAPRSPDQDRMTEAYVALLARRAQLLDVAERAYATLEREAPASPLLANVDGQVHRRIGDDAINAACKSGRSRADLGCLNALRASGHFDVSLYEIGRLRGLRSDGEALRPEELGLRVQRGDLKGALAVYDAMPPSQRDMLSALGLAAGRGALNDAKTRLARDLIDAHDAPFAEGPLRAAIFGEDPAIRLEQGGAKIVAQDREHAFLPGAGTAVLRHIEDYVIEANGLVRCWFYDLRRVSGTADVESGAQSYGARVEGRYAPRMLRRRIHKKDGRVLEPDAANMAAQGHADLSQLETGDYIEQIVSATALPGDSGQLVIDTPDLLPERTSVREAVIRVRRAESIPMSEWSHPLLGKPEITHQGSYVESVWRLKDTPPRRIEDGVPRMERGVNVSLGTQTWAQIARFMSDNVRSLDDKDPFVTRWAESAAGADKTPSRALVERIVAAAGKTVKVASGSELADMSAVYGGGSQSDSARTMLELGQGSRSWVIYRALRELGVSAELAVAESEPFSSSPDFPPHVGRFRHPLVVAHLGGATPDDVWIDGDVEGPPLPPGHVSPELRGRSAMLSSGSITPVQGASGDNNDEVDVRLVLDPKGDAKGTFTVLLHGRPAQGLAEAFETVVGSDRRQLLRGVVLGWLPWADVEDVSLSPVSGSSGVALRASIAVHGYGQPEGKDGKVWVLPGLEAVHMVFPRTAVGTLGATYASRGGRQSTLAIESAIQYHVHRRVELPPGAVIARAPAGVGVHDKRIDASRKGSFDGKLVEEDFTLSLPTQNIAADGYQTFVEQVHAIDDGFMAGTRIKVKP